MACRLTFLGGVQTVTGSKYLVEWKGARLLVDAGLFQGLKDLRLRNRAPFPVDPASLDAVILTHAHIDHSGYLPALVKAGFNGPVYASVGTAKLCGLLLPDSGFLQEEEARYANKHGYSKHHPAEPLYTEEEARYALTLFRPQPLSQYIEVAPGLTLRFEEAGHILGATSVQISNGHRVLLFSGDLGKQQDWIEYPPTPVKRADVLVIESTYGDRRHPQIDALEALAEVINRTCKRGGTLLLPAFAVGRAQLVLYLIQQLQEAGRIPKLPVYLNSPMAISATEIFCDEHASHRLTAAQCQRIDAMTTYVRTVEESQALAQQRFPSIIVSASGMATGGRVLHHLRYLAPNPANTILFLGFQAAGTRGQAMVQGAEYIKLLGEQVAVKAEVLNLEALSAHGDYEDILQWLVQIKTPPQQVFVTHGETAAASAMVEHIHSRLGWREVRSPELGEQVELFERDGDWNEGEL